MKPETSLQQRLSRSTIATVLLGLLLASVLSSIAAWHEVRELYDGQQKMFASQLLDAAPLLGQPEARLGAGKSDHQAVAVWDSSGRLRLADEQGEQIPRQPGAHGWQNAGDWRVYYLSNRDYTVAVAQELNERRELLIGILTGQALVWLLLMPLLVWVLRLAVRRGLRPLAHIRQQLLERRVDDSSPLPLAVPEEVQPLIGGMNALIARLTATLARERRFTADAAHELRSPLAGLRVQAEVARISSDAAGRNHALNGIELGVERATRLVEQLLALARLDPLQEPGEARPVHWPQVLHEVLDELARQSPQLAERCHCEWLTGESAVLPVRGNPALLGMLLRNLLDNALRYGSPDGEVALRLGEDSIEICDDGPGVAPEHLARLGERFFRPPGQSQTGSGLGLSIADRVAELHGLRLSFANRAAGGFVATLSRRQA